MNDHSQTRAGRQRSGCLKRFAWIALAVVLVVSIARLMALQGWIRPLRVVGGSMANSLLGSHYLVQCDDCGFSFPCGAQYVPSSARVVCPNCGYPDNRLTSRILRGRRVLVDRWSGWLRGPRVWQTVALHTPHQSRQLTVKRIVAGGPGKIEIRNGDVYLDGRIQQKTATQLRQMWVLVHDDRYRPTRDASLPARWAGAEDATCWTPFDAGYAYVEPPNANRDTFDWLEYHQWTCWPGGGPIASRTQSTAIFDHYGYNQNVTRGPLNMVPDIALAGALRWKGRGRIALRQTVDRDCFELILEPSRRTFRLRHNGKTLRQGPVQLASPSFYVELALCDHRLLATIDGTTLICHAYQPTPVESGNRVQQIAVGARGLELQFVAPRVYRDVYYLGPGRTLLWQATAMLTKGQWFVLGDNAPVSLDSRSWQAIERRSVLGPVIPRDH